MKIYRLLLLSLLIISCTSKESSSILEEIGKETFILDASSSFNIRSAEFYLNNSKNEKFSFLNINNNSLVIYKDSIPIKIELEKEGANGVGTLNPFTSHKILPNNNIALVQSEMGKVFILDEKGKVINKFQLFDINDRKSFYSFPYNSINNPISFSNDYLYFTESLVKYFENYNNLPVLKKISISDGKSENLFPLPKVYEKNFWGALFKYNVSICKTNEDNFFLVSTPISETIYKINIEGQIIQKIECKSKFIDEIEPMNDDKLYGNKNNSDWNKINSYSLTTSDYNSIIFDSFKNLYYRIVYLRPNLEEYISGQKKPDFSVIVMDSKFNILGEQKFDADVYANNFILVSRKGLAIARKDLYDLDNDRLVFSIFDLK